MRCPWSPKRWRLGLGLGFRGGCGPGSACSVACMVYGSLMRLLIESACFLDLAVRVRVEFVTLERTPESCFSPPEFWHASLDDRGFVLLLWVTPEALFCTGVLQSWARVSWIGLPWDWGTRQNRIFHLGGQFFLLKIHEPICVFAVGCDLYCGNV
jgi:hypothetical protein